MPSRSADLSEALIFDPSETLLQELRIFLMRHCGLDARLHTTVDGFEFDLSRPAPSLLVSSGYTDGSGLALMRRARALGMPSFILFIDRQNSPDEAGDGFAAGADDVIRAPFTLREFGLRLRARLGPDFVSDDDWFGRAPAMALDTGNRLIAAGCSRAAFLTPAEAEVMAVLIHRGGMLVTRDELSRRIDKCEWSYGDRKFDVHVTKIRKKLKDAFGKRFVVRSIRAEGYLLAESPLADRVAFAQEQSD